MESLHFYTGSYTQGDLFPGSCGAGIERWELNPDSGQLRWCATFREITNPSWISVSPTGRYLAAVSEHADGCSRVYLASRKRDGTLAMLDSHPTGDCSCHVAFSPDEKWVGVASYMGGSCHIGRIDDGRFTDDWTIFKYEGKGANSERQEGPHAHQVVFSSDGSRLLVPDLGSDRIWIHRLDGNAWSMFPEGIKMPPGEGPRHCIELPDESTVLVFAELTGNLHRVALHPGKESGHLLDTAPGLPDEWEGQPSGAAIRKHPQLSIVYTSHRSGGLLSWFRIAAPDQSMPRIGFLKLDDPTPRDFNTSPDGRWLIVAGQDGSKLHVHPLDRTSGDVLPSIGSYSCGSPVCIAWE